MQKKRKTDGDNASELGECLTLWGSIVVAGFVWYMTYWYIL